MLKGVRDFVLVILSSVLLVLPYHFGEVYFLAYFAFVPFFYALEKRTSGGIFRASFFFGLFFYVLLGYWLTRVNVFGFIALVAYLALYFGVFGFLVASYLSPRDEAGSWGIQRNVRALFYVSAIWTALEVVRGWLLSGFPWALLSYTQWKNIPFIQIADITGAWGVSFFLMAVNVCIYKMIKILFGKESASKNSADPASEKWTLLRSVSLALAGILALLYGYGFFILGSRDAFYKKTSAQAKARISVVQGNIPQDQKWDARIKNIIFEKYKRLTLMSAAEKPDLIVWPETSFPGYIEDEPILAAHLRSLVRQTHTQALVGAPTVGDIEKEGVKFYNSALFFDSDGEEKGRYHKMHLVPFGEYIPIEPLFGILRNFVQIGRFSHGQEKTIFTLSTRHQKPNIKARFGVLICYEDIFPGLVRDFCRGGADFLVNITNDAWFGKTSAPYQHAQASIFRAVENRVNIVRSANTGYSCFISPEGRVLGAVEDKGEAIFVSGHKSLDLLLRKSASIYTRFGDLFLILVAGLCVMAYRDRRGSSSNL